MATNKVFPVSILAAGVVHAYTQMWTQIKILENPNKS